MKLTHRWRINQLLYALSVFLFTWALCLANLLVGCDNLTTDPSPTTTTTTIPVDPWIGPRVDVDFDWYKTVSFSAFATLDESHTDQQLYESTMLMLSHGINTRRMCAETEYWGGDWPYLQAFRDLDRLNHVLDILARIPGAQVIVVANCTLKGPVPLSEQHAWAGLVAGVVREYRNVAVEVINEMDQCRGRGWGNQCYGKNDVRTDIDMFRGNGVRNVTSDDHICIGDPTYAFRFANIGAWPADFHYCRTARNGPWDPIQASRQGLSGDNFLDQAIDANGGFVYFGETVSYNEMGDDCDGLRTCDIGRVQSHFDRCLIEHAGHCITNFHSIAGLAGDGWTEIPNARH